MSPDFDERDDVALVEAHVAGDPTAFGELFRRHRDRLWAVAVRTTGNPEDAADALQDALVSAFRRAKSYRGDAAVTTWLHRIVVNACLDRMRRAKVRAADPLPDDLDQHAARGELLATPEQGPDPGPEAQLLSGERRRRVLAALDALPPDQKAALVLVDMEGYPVAQVAEILQTPTGTVKSRCARGRARLAVLLADLGPLATTPPVANQPGSTSPGTTSPGTTSPVANQPGTTSPGSTSPGSNSPASPGATPAATRAPADPGTDAGPAASHSGDPPTPARTRPSPDAPDPAPTDDHAHPSARGGEQQ